MIINPLTQPNRRPVFHSLVDGGSPLFSLWLIDCMRGGREHLWTFVSEMQYEVQYSTHLSSLLQMGNWSRKTTDKTNLPTYRPTDGDDNVLYYKRRVDLRCCKAKREGKCVVWETTNIIWTILSSKLLSSCTWIQDTGEWRKLIFHLSIISTGSNPLSIFLF